MSDERKPPRCPHDDTPMRLGTALRGVGVNNFRPAVSMSEVRRLQDYGRVVVWKCPKCGHSHE